MIRTLVTGAFAAILLGIGVAAAVTSDIGGYAVYSEFPINDGHAAKALESTPVELYKRTAANGWEKFGDTVYTEADGSFLFDDVDIGTGANGLFENAEFFKVHIDATDQLPEGWPSGNGYTRDRFAHKDRQPPGFPEAGKIRVDAVFLMPEGIPPTIPGSYPLYFSGRLVCFDEEGQGFTPDLTFPAKAENQEGTCPAGNQDYKLEFAS